MASLEISQRGLFFRTQLFNVYYTNTFLIHNLECKIPGVYSILLFVDMDPLGGNKIIAKFRNVIKALG